MTNYAKRSSHRVSQNSPAPAPGKPEENYSSLLNKWRDMAEQDIKNEMAGLAKRFRREDRTIFTVRTADEWMAQSMHRPAPCMLFSEFWHEGELCILFADTNLGKSILAVQIGNSIGKGIPIPGFRLEAPAQPVVYFDFELSDKQFEARYSKDYTGHYEFGPDFYRVEIDAAAEIPEDGKLEELLSTSIEKAIKDTGARVLIIDNITYLKDETEKARHALPLMKQLKTLKQRHNLSILALAHTPKRDPGKPISRNDLQGSKILMNFCDSAFAIGQSYADKNCRYLKQIKQRYTESLYDEEHVIVCQTTKPDNFLRFEILDYATEWEHLKRVTENEPDELTAKVKELMDKEPGLPVIGIARRLCPDESKLNSFRVKIHRIAQRLRAA